MNEAAGFFDHRSAWQAVAPKGPEMPAKIAVICFGLSRDRARRQPWHVAFGLASGLAASGHDVELLTDAKDPPGTGEFQVRQFARLMRRGRFDQPLRDHLARGFSQVFMITGPTELWRMRQLMGSHNAAPSITLIMASARLLPSEILRLGGKNLLCEWRLLLRPLINSCLPGSWLRQGFLRSGAASLTYLSTSAATRFYRAGLPADGMVQPQVLQRVWPLPDELARRTITYFGPALELRGAFTALQSFEAACARGLNAELQMLIRPDDDVDRSDELIKAARRSPWSQRITIQRRYLEAEQLLARLTASHVFLLPFRITVSDVPLVVIEAALSGRPVVTLNAPGVGEVAQRLGGIVVDHREDLPNAIIHASRRPIAAVPDQGWCDWVKATGEFAQSLPSIDRRIAMIGLCGVDGAGKTALVNALRARLAQDDITTRHVWSRFRNYLSKPLLALTRLTGHNRKQVRDGVVVGYHEFSGSKLLSLGFIALQTLDNLLDMALRYRSKMDEGRPQLIVGDRCVLDTLVDLAIDTGRDDLLFGKLGQFLRRRLPQPNMLIVIDRDPAAIVAHRPDVLADRDFVKRRALYRRLAHEFGLAVVQNDRPVEAVVDDIIALVSLPQAAAARAMPPAPWSQLSEISA